jgi:hypothetical protein
LHTSLQHIQALQLCIFLLGSSERQQLAPCSITSTPCAPLLSLTSLAFHLQCASGCRLLAGFCTSDRTASRICDHRDLQLTTRSSLRCLSSASAALLPASPLSLPWPAQPQVGAVTPLMSVHAARARWGVHRSAVEFKLSAGLLLLLPGCVLARPLPKPATCSALHCRPEDSPSCSPRPAREDATRRRRRRRQLGCLILLWLDHPEP